ncbi:MAG: hypothetical protein KatS3mg029_0192 [Saprospiraceae bacterium]|nr:MAG: hypothetical protein KatS3mg029_0192 [Saprospiraceae bacterium]
MYFLDGGFLQLDLLTALVRKHLTYLDAEYVFATSVEEGGVVRCAPRVLLEHVLLFNYLNGSGLPWKYVRHFSTYNDRRQFELFTFINDKYGTDFCSIQSMTVFKPHRRQAFEASVARLPANRLVLRARRFLNWLRDTGRELLCERGLTITFSGVDGAGKSTILHSVKELLAHKYRRKVVVLRHRPGLLPILSAWRYGKAKAEQRAASRLPRQGDNGSVPASLLRFLYYFMDYFIGQWYVWLRYTARGYVVLYDRYYFDFIADERRSNLNLGPLGFFAALALLDSSFEPELNFFLYADAAIIHRRKQELPLEAIEALSRRYRSLFERAGPPPQGPVRQHRKPAHRRYPPHHFRTLCGRGNHIQPRPTSKQTPLAMIKSLLTRLLRRKNPAFRFDEHVRDSFIRTILFGNTVAWIRSWKLLLRGYFPRWLFLGRGVRLRNLGNIELSPWIRLEDGVHIDALGRGSIQLGRHVRIGAYSRLIISTTLDNLGAYIRIGNNVGIGEFAYLGGAGGLEIGDDCIIGQYFSCHPENHNFDNPKKLIRLQGVTRKGIRIGKNCWIGSKVTILDGVTIGDNCVIAAGAVVTKSMPAGSVIGGVPAKVLRPVKKQRPVEYDYGYANFE